MADVDTKTALAACGLVVMAALSTATDPTSPTSNASDPAPSRSDKTAAVSRDERSAVKPDAKQPAQPEAKQPADKKPGVAPPADKKPGKAGPKKAAVPGSAVLLPHKPQGSQDAFRPTPEQVNNARTIVKVSRKMGLPPRAAVVAVATSLQESKLINLGHLGDRNDHDSQGLFQQRPTSGWGSVDEITDPVYSSTAFYKALTQVPGWQSMSLSEAAQKVQVSAYPMAYAKWEIMAYNLVQAYYGTGPYAGIGK
ncbi:MAG: hypothetical protein ACRDTU_20700 [Micromonosporaceae bacterium]